LVFLSIGETEVGKMLPLPISCAGKAFLVISMEPQKEAGGTPAVPGLRGRRRFRGLLRRLA
jgi:hypothetical protein